MNDDDYVDDVGGCVERCLQKIGVWTNVLSRGRKPSEFQGEGRQRLSVLVTVDGRAANVHFWRDVSSTLSRQKLETSIFFHQSYAISAI